MYINLIIVTNFVCIYIHTMYSTYIQNCTIQITNKYLRKQPLKIFKIKYLLTM